MTVEHQRALFKRPHTIGEELWEIHLTRSEALRTDGHFLDYNGSDSDEKQQKVRRCSIGEELWEVHLKRSENMNDEEDKDTLEMPDGKEMSEKSLLDGDETCEASNHDTKGSVPLCDTGKEKKSVQSKIKIDARGS